MVLFVDDDKTLIHTVERSLKSLHCEVTTMSSGNSAIKWLSLNNPCDLIITDIHMADGSGVDLVVWQKTNHPSIPVVIITGDNILKLNELEQFCEIMHLPIISKPFNSQKLTGVLNEYYHCKIKDIAS